METKAGFLAAFQGIFDDTLPEEIQLDTEFKEIGEWSSLVALATIVMFEEQFSTSVTAKEIDDAKTVNDLYNIVANQPS